MIIVEDYFTITYDAFVDTSFHNNQEDIDSKSDQTQKTNEEISQVCTQTNGSLSSASLALPLPISDTVFANQWQLKGASRSI